VSFLVGKLHLNKAGVKKEIHYELRLRCLKETQPTDGIVNFVEPHFITQLYYDPDLDSIFRKVSFMEVIWAF
jgi:hypothetical protein